MSVIEQPHPFLSGEAVYHQVPKKFAPHFAQWLGCNSTKELEADEEYVALASEIQSVLSYCDVGDFSNAASPAKSSYRILAWNLERGIRYEEQLQALRTHPYLKTCDVLLLTETDLPIPKIAEATGYGSASYLGQVFRQALGTTPARFRRQIRAG